MSKLLIRDGRIVTAFDDYSADILVSGGRIVAIGEKIDADAEVHDAAGLLVLPGGVDVHTHLDNDTGISYGGHLRDGDQGSGLQGHHDAY